MDTPRGRHPLFTAVNAGRGWNLRSGPPTEITSNEKEKKRSQVGTILPLIQKGDPVPRCVSVSIGVCGALL